MRFHGTSDGSDLRQFLMETGRNRGRVCPAKGCSPVFRDCRAGTGGGAGDHETAWGRELRRLQVLGMCGIQGFQARASWMAVGTWLPCFGDGEDLAAASLPLTFGCR